MAGLGVPVHPMPPSKVNNYLKDTPLAQAISARINDLIYIIIWTAVLNRSDILIATLLNKLLPKYFGEPGNQWRYALADDYGYSSPHLAGIDFQNDWVTIRDGNIAIKAGYAWDGCSPCLSVLGLFYVGTPDGAQHLGLRATYHASLVHDVLCQWRQEIPITKAATVAVFRQLMDDVEFSLSGLYAAAVTRFGPQDFFCGVLLLPKNHGKRAGVK